MTADVRVVSVPDGLAGERVDAAVSRLFGLSRSQVAGLIESGDVLLDGGRVAKSARVGAGDVLEVGLPAPAAPPSALPSPAPALPVQAPLDEPVMAWSAADAQALLKIAEDRALVGLILGLPRNMDGSEGPRAQSTRAFARNLERLTPLPISFWDERLSTVAAERALLEGDTSRKRRAEVIDQVAAGYILQGALDRLRHIG